MPLFQEKQEDFEASAEGGSSLGEGSLANPRRERDVPLLVP